MRLALIRGIIVFMPSRASKKKNRDFFANARRVVEQAIGEQMDGSPLEKEPLKNEAAVALSKLGASKGGKARAAKLTPAQREAIAKKAAKARWND
jgi:ribosomal protein S6E (S10)